MAPVPSAFAIIADSDAFGFFKYSSLNFSPAISAP